MRRVWWARALAVACVASYAACGGEQDAGSGAAGSPAPPAQTPKPPPAADERPEIQRGQDDEAPGGAGSGSEAGGSGPGDGPSDGGGSGESSVGGGRGGTYDPERPDEEGNDVPPPSGSPAERFERFCEKNPRECY